MPPSKTVSSASSLSALFVQAAAEDALDYTVCALSVPCAVCAIRAVVFEHLYTTIQVIFRNIAACSSASALGTVAGRLASGHLLHCEVQCALSGGQYQASADLLLASENEISRFECLPFH